MLQARRNGVEVWVTAISGLLAGEDFCYYKAWTQSHYWVRSTQEFDRAAWIADHAAMLRARVKVLLEEGFTCAIEKQNGFTLFGKTAKLSGKPDIIAHHPDSKVVVVSDVKTGRAENKHLYQMYEYLIALPQLRPDFSGYTWRGELVYKDSRHDITFEEAQRAKPAIYAMVREMGFDMPPVKTPSEDECGKCSLSTDDCSEKARMVGSRATGETNDF